MSNDRPFINFAQAWELVHGRKPTPEELETASHRAHMVLDSIEISLRDSEYIWGELEGNDEV